MIDGYHCNGLTMMAWELICLNSYSWLYHQSIHYDDVIMSTIASQTTSLTIVYSTVYPGADQSKHQSSASLAFVWGIHRGPVNSPHKWPVTRKMFPFDDVIMLEPQELTIRGLSSIPKDKNFFEMTIGDRSIFNDHIRVHDHVIKWKHFPRYWPSVRGIHRSPVNTPPPPPPPPPPPKASDAELWCFRWSVPE